MLLQDFYSISNIKSEEGNITATILFHADHDIFKGHFPTIPVVPGVCMMQIVKELLETQLSKKLLLTAASQMKFLSMITPTEVPEVDAKMNHTNTATGIDVQAELYSPERSYFKMKATYIVE